jgi:hypothetical protein
VGLLAAFTATITRSLLAGIAAALLLAFSYTFWSQALIAEVYTLHLALVGGCLLALHAYAARPSDRRLFVFFAVYASAFGNHLSMILLAPAFAWAVLRATPDRRTLLRPRVAAVTAVIVAAAALQYLPNLLAVWSSPDAPPGVRDRVAAFWFDVTKADWREAMVGTIGASQLPDRLAMWWFDVRQQFGLPGIALAAAGAAVLWRQAPLWGSTLGLAWIVASLFALTYNVGDAHVFFLTAHYVMALTAGAALAGWMTPGNGLEAARKGAPYLPGVRSVLAVLVMAYAGWRGWETWPVLDRHLDRRAEQTITRLTAGLSASNAVLVTQLDWQLENTLFYHTRFVQPGLAWERLPDALLRWPSLVDETHRAGRDVVLSAEAAQAVIAAYGNAYPMLDDPIPPAVTLATAVSRIPRGAPYVLTLLPPPRGTTAEPEAIDAALRALTGGEAPSLPPAPYRVVAGLAGEAASFTASEQRPFRRSFALLGDEMDVRMESWLATDTFRRAGFGHVLRGRERVLIAERGVSLIWFRADGTPADPFYAAGIYASRPRFRIPAGAPQLARARP